MVSVILISAVRSLAMVLVSLSLAPHFSEVVTFAAKAISRFNGFP
jgi:hypothetical protein